MAIPLGHIAAAVHVHDTASSQLAHAAVHHQSAELHNHPALEEFQDETTC